MQPNKAFLGEKESFKVDVADLDTLLAYTEKDDKEAVFEVSIFAELFREMLEARFGQGILRVLEVLEKEDRLVCHQKQNSILTLSVLSAVQHCSSLGWSCNRGSMPSSLIICALAGGCISSSLLAE